VILPEPIGYKFKEYCNECNTMVVHKIIAHIRYNNPIMKCAVCECIAFDRINKDDIDEN
jgi:RNase P subunit RPR2